ncbi:MAG: hypothetical protein OXI75_02265 [Rhodospirillales bacterium]|nr:hypothetical protein [Rhodospirillales bacterium]
MIGLERAHDLQFLLIGYRKRASARPRVDVRSKECGQLSKPLIHRTLRDERTPRLGAAEKNIGRRRHLRNDGEFLIDGGNAGALLGPRAVDGDTLAEDFYGPAVGTVGACENLDQCRLAGTVLADEAVNLTGIEVEVDLLERPNTRKGFRKSAHIHRRKGLCASFRHRLGFPGQSHGPISTSR